MESSIYIEETRTKLSSFFFFFFELCIKKIKRTKKEENKKKIKNLCTKHMDSFLKTNSPY